MNWMYADELLKAAYERDRVTYDYYKIEHERAMVTSQLFKGRDKSISEGHRNTYEAWLIWWRLEDVWNHKPKWAEYEDLLLETEHDLEDHAHHLADMEYMCANSNVRKDDVYALLLKKGYNYLGSTYGSNASPYPTYLFTRRRRRALSNISKKPSKLNRLNLKINYKTM